MVKRRKTATRAAAKKPIKKPNKAAAPSKPAKSRKFTPDDHVTALVVAVVIVIVFAALYLYQNTKPKAALLDGGPAIVLVEKA